MELQNRRQLPMARDVAWIALNDPGVLRQCIPGCESLDRIDDTTWSIVLAASAGPVKGRFTGRMTLTDVIAPTSYTLHFDGLGPTAGFGRGTAAITLQPQGPMTTVLTYDAHAQIGGELAHLDSSLIDDAARRFADEFLTRFIAVVAPHHAVGEPVAADGEVAAAMAAGRATREAPGANNAAGRSGLARWWPWAVAAVILILIVMWGNHAS